MRLSAVELGAFPHLARGMWLKVRCIALARTATEIAHMFRGSRWGGSWSLLGKSTYWLCFQLVMLVLKR